MRIDLQQSDVGGLGLDLPPGADGSPQRVRLRSAKGLAAQVEQGPGQLSVEGIQVEEAMLEALRLAFGAVHLSQDEGASLAQVRGSVERMGDETSLDLEASSVVAGHLAVDTRTVHVHGELRVEGFRLQVRGREGRIEGDQVHAAGFALGIGAAKGTAVELRARRLQLGWGASGFWMEADALEGPSLRFVVGGMRLHAHGVEVGGFRMHRGDVAVGEGRVRDLTASAVVGASEGPQDTEAPPAEGPRSTAARPAPKGDGGLEVPFDWRLLDGLSGAVNADLRLEVGVPVIGRRRATHRFRIPIEDGSIDYRRLESDLSALEGSLVDFSVRDDRTLAVEVGVPLLPTRGHGKPILLWDLEEGDRALARKHRVRLAVLPRYRLASRSSAPPPPNAPAPEGSKGRGGGARVSLRRFDLTGLGVDLSHGEVSGPLSGAVQRLVLQALHVEGDLHYDGRSAPQEGALRGMVQGLELRLSRLGLGGTRSLDLRDLRLERLSDLRLRFAGIRPAAVELEGAGLSLDGFHLRPGE